MKHPNMFTSKTNEWTTPQSLFDELNTEFSFTLDPCCTHENAKCTKYFTVKDDGLTQDWSGDRVFMNPPYGRQIKSWMKKAWEESQRGALVVCLVPARTDTKWWHDYVMQTWPHGIRFIKGRPNYNEHNGPGRSTFASVLVIFQPSNTDPSEEPQDAIRRLQGG